LSEPNKNLISPDGLIEICEMPEGDLAGRTKIKMTALEIHTDKTSYNDNGITWIEDYINDNFESIISAPFVVSWFDEENQIPSDHGTMSFDDEGNVEFEGVSVGSIQNAYIEDREINGDNKKVLTCEGVIYNQRYPKFVDWLKEELSNGTVFGSVEINGKGKNKKIKYDGDYKNSDGSLIMGRKPKVFDFSGLAILSSLVQPADKNSQVIGINNKNKEVSKVANNQSVEINELCYDDIACLVENEFNKKYNISSDEYKYFYIYKFYPTSSTFVMKSWSCVGEYYQSSYTIENAKVTIGDIIKVEDGWKPVDGGNAIEVNNTPINILKNTTKEVNIKMDEKVVLELNQKIEEKINEINTLSKEIEDKTAEINSLTEKNTNLETNISELNSTLVEVNKLVESEKTEKEKLEVEVNEYREAKNKAENDAKITEVNAYFDTEISKNGFDDTELNSLKEYVTNVDLAGLKTAEAELCAKKFKELVSKKPDVETNSKGMFIPTITKDKKPLGNKKISFFEE
jgi:hypothetical protein